jgi:hypothetical protein
MPKPITNIDKRFEKFWKENEDNPYFHFPHPIPKIKAQAIWDNGKIAGLSSRVQHKKAK